MEWVYEAPYDIPALGVEAGDVVIVAPAAEVPLVVVREFDRGRLPAILEHLDSLTLLPSSGAMSPQPLREHLERAVGCDSLAPTSRLRLLE